MPQSLANVLIHMIFSTKNREPTVPRELLLKLHAYIAGILEQLHCPSLQTGGVVDHVHSLFSLGRTVTVAAVVEEVKKGSSKSMKTQGVLSFAWQAGYVAFSVSESQKTAVIRYIQRQEEHHQRNSCEDEIRQFLVRHRVAYDERYVWD